MGRIEERIAAVQRPLLARSDPLADYDAHSSVHGAMEDDVRSILRRGLDQPPKFLRLGEVVAIRNVLRMLADDDTSDYFLGCLDEFSAYNFFSLLSRMEFVGAFDIHLGAYLSMFFREMLLVPELRAFHRQAIGLLLHAIASKRGFI